MSQASKTRSMFADFAASLVMAISIGLATSVALAGAVLLIAQHQAAETQSVPASSPSGSAS
jgi:hypothetical protein